MTTSDQMESLLPSSEAEYVNFVIKPDFVNTTRCEYINFAQTRPAICDTTVLRTQFRQIWRKLSFASKWKLIKQTTAILNTSAQ